MPLTHFIYGYMALEYGKGPLRSQLMPHGLLSLISSKGSFICTITQRG